jgi:2-alkyl-3-oxoalkanoate reductase
LAIAVTGANGFLGREVVRQLRARGDAVIAITRRPDAELAALGADNRLADVRDLSAMRSAMQGASNVIHTAAVAGIWGPWKHFYETNTVGAKHVIALCRELGISRLVFSSSPSVTFAATDQCNLSEAAPYASKWLCHYPHSKALAEIEVLGANEPGKLLTCALRPHLIWGPGDHHLIPRLIDRARQGKLAQVGAGENLIDMIYIENAAEAHLQALAKLVPHSPTCGKAYFLSQGEPVNCWNWIAEILSLAGLDRPKRKLSFGAAWNVGRMLEGAHALFRIQAEPRMTRFLAAQLALSHYFDITAARRDLGYAPKISTTEGMRRLGAWLAETQLAK